MAVTATIKIKKKEAGKLLDLLGHEEVPKELAVELVKKLYRCTMAFASEDEALDLDISMEDIVYIHSKFTPAGFGEEGRDFRLKLGSAILAIERNEYLSNET